MTNQITFTSKDLVSAKKEILLNKMSESELTVLAKQKKESLSSELLGFSHHWVFALAVVILFVGTYTSTLIFLDKSDQTICAITTFGGFFYFFNLFIEQDGKQNAINTLSSNFKI